MKKVITESERLQLLGLLTIAVQHAKAVNQAEDAMAEILEHHETYVDHLSDAVYEYDTNIDPMLKNMGIRVKK